MAAMQSSSSIQLPSVTEKAAKASSRNMLGKVAVDIPDLFKVQDFKEYPEWDAAGSVVRMPLPCVMVMHFEVCRWDRADLAARAAGQA